MFDHVKFGVSNYRVSRAFFLKALEPLGVVKVTEWPPNGVEIVATDGASLCLYQTDEKPAHLHLAFVANSRREVEAFYRAALEAGGRDNVRPVYARSTVATTMQRSSSGRTDTTLKPSTTSPRRPSSLM